MRAVKETCGDQTTVAAFWVKGIADTFEAAGLDSHALFEEAGLELAALSDVDARFPTERISLLWQLAETHSVNPAIGLANSNVAKPGNFDVVAYAMMSSPNLLGILQRLIRYVDIISNAAALALEDDREGHRLILELFGGERPIPRQRFEFDLMTILSFCRWVTRGDLSPLAIELRFPAPADLRSYQDAFKCPLRFNAPVNALLFARADVMLPLPTANSLLAEIHERVASERLRRLDHAPTCLQARALMIRHLPDGEPRRPKIAAALGMSERTLQRRLAAEGASFQRLLDDMRRELAQQYLGQRNVSLADAAYLLGFSDQSSFFRAARRWFGTSPRHYRTRLIRDERDRP
jgi:AraC-like DNA-binding protein